MKDDDGIRIEVKPVARTRAQGREQRRYGLAVKCAVVVLVGALVSVVVESWGVRHVAAEFAGGVLGVLAQQMIPPRVRWVTVGWICLAIAAVCGVLAFIQR